MPTFPGNSLAEGNYDIRNQELLAIKLALEEWRHWLEGALHPFQVHKDHCNLEYLREAKRLNVRQAHWVLFFTHFEFQYIPGSKNIKADALSHHSDAPKVPEEPVSILPASCLACPSSLDLEEQLERLA